MEDGDVEADAVRAIEDIDERVFLDLYHYKFASLEIHHYNLSI